MTGRDCWAKATEVERDKDSRNAPRKAGLWMWICMRVDSQRDVGRHCEGLCRLASKARGIGRIGAPRPTLSRVTTKRRQVSWLAGRRRGPPSREHAFSVAYGRRLAAYSCGGSRGIVRKRTHRVPF